MRRSQTVAAVAAAACLVVPGTATSAAAAGTGAAGTQPAGTGAAASGCAGVVRLAPGGAALAPSGLSGRAASATWLTTMSCTATGIRHGAATGQADRAGQQTNTSFSTNWSGYQVNQSAGFAQGGWHVPTVTRPVPGYSSIGYYSSTWAGIGGGFNAGNGALIQAGTTQSISSTGVISYYAWYEIVGGTGDTGSEIRINNLPVHPGDFVGGVGLWNAVGGAQAGVCNFAINTCISFTLASSAPGTTAEWVVEAPSGSTGILPLANFGSVHFTNGCWEHTFVQGAPCATIASGGPRAIDLQTFVFNTVQIIAAPGALDADGFGFTDTYRQPFPPDPCPRC